MVSILLKIFAGLLAVAALALAAMLIDGAPGSMGAAVARIEANARQALGPAADWASVEFHGQSVLVAGEAPDPAARADLLRRLRGAGGVTHVDDVLLVVAAPAPPPQPEETQAPSPVETEPVETAPAETAPVEAGTAPTSIEDLIVAAAESDPSPPAAAPPGDATTPAPPQTDAPPTPSIAPRPQTDCVADLAADARNRAIRFASAGVEIDEGERAFLRQLSRALRDCPEARMTITGHTDSSGARRRNLQLSSYRADAVRAFLVSTGAPEARIAARGAGASEPLADNASPEGRARNRRIDISVSRIED